MVNSNKNGNKKVVIYIYTNILKEKSKEYLIDTCRAIYTNILKEKPKEYLIDTCQAMVENFSA